MDKAQAAILCGGLGSRLGARTVSTPKPLLQVGDRPFLDYLLFELGRHGIRRIVLLAGFGADAVREYARDHELTARMGLEIEVSVEDRPAGTGGAVWQARSRLEDVFFLLNGDTWFDINLHALSARRRVENCMAALALRQIPNPDRYNVVTFDGHRITNFSRERRLGQAGLINGGVAVCSLAVMDRFKEVCSLEDDVWPQLAAAGELAGMVSDGYFIDIGVPEAFDRAQVEVPKRLFRPAALLDRDGVLNEDLGYCSSKHGIQWIDGAMNTVRLFNDKGWYVFVVTNQAGVAREYYSEADVIALHEHMQAQLIRHGAHIDDFCYCPHHVDGVLGEYAVDCNWRRPAPGRIEDLMEKWPIDRARSIMIGDKDSDVDIARAAGVQGYKFSKGSLLDFVSTMNPRGRS